MTGKPQYPERTELVGPACSGTGLGPLPHPSTPSSSKRHPLPLAPLQNCGEGHTQGPWVHLPIGDPRLSPVRSLTRREQEFLFAFSLEGVKRWILQKVVKTSGSPQAWMSKSLT